MRKLFIGLPLSPLLTGELYRQTSGIKEPFIRWTSPENLHLTVCFIGHVEEEKASEISGILDTVSFPSFILQPKDIIPVKRKSQVNMIWLTFEPSQEFTELSVLIHEKTGIKMERPPLAHVTLARVKAYPKGSFPRLETDLNREIKLEAERLILYESRSEGKGSSYIPLSGTLLS